MSHETLYLTYPKRLEVIALKARQALERLSFPCKKLEGAPKDGSLVLVMLDLDSREEEIYSFAPWLKEQFAYSSFKALRVMPFLFYHGQQGDIEEAFDERLSETMESVFSGEFKPFGYDLDAENPLREFPSVYETYEE